MRVRITDKARKKLAKETTSILHKLLLQILGEELSKIPAQSVADLKVSMFGYIMHVSSFIEFKRGAKASNISSANCHKILHAILENFETGLALRQCVVIYLAKTKANEKVNCKKLLVDCQLDIGNAVLLECLNEMTFGANTLLKRAKKPLLYPAQIQRDCNTVMAEIKTWVTKFVRRKLQFVVKHNNYEVQDLVSDLARKGVETYYRLTPFYDGEHRINSVKRSIHNQGMKFISFYTSKKRARIERKSDGEFITKVDSFVDSLDRVSDAKMLDIEWQKPTLQFESSRVISSFIGNSTNRAGIIRKLMCEEDDVHFTQFVQTKLNTSEAVSVEFLSSRKPKAYVALIADYHQVPVLTVRRIAYELLSKLNGNN